MKKNQPGHTYAVDDEEPVEEQQEPNGIYEVDDELEEIQEWHDEAILALAEEPTDGEVLANFREARKALDQARTARSVQGIAHKTVDFVVHRQLAAAQQVKPLLRSQDLMHLLGGRKGFFQHKEQRNHHCNASLWGDAQMCALFQLHPNTGCRNLIINIFARIADSTTPLKFTIYSVGGRLCDTWPGITENHQVISCCCKNKLKGHWGSGFAR